MSANRKALPAVFAPLSRSVVVLSAPSQPHCGVPASIR